ncbi:MAG: hypothetical protein J6B34_02290 [Clostridia bacterium]|nr:hypothetical protein [Clostridia bacterium]
MKNTFYKNLFQSISVFLALFIVYIPLIFGYIESLKHESDLGWILLVAPLSLFVLYFSLGSFWIFQKVVIDEMGIKIVLFRRVIRESKWEEIDTIEEANIMKNPAIRIILTNASEIHLDKRKSIIRAIEKYSQKNVVK